MTRIEQRVRDSLQARATDVEPTPDLWDAVDRRITRRRRVRVTAWALAGAAALAAVLVVPGLLTGTISLPDIEPITPPPVEEVEVDVPAEPLIVVHDRDLSVVTAQEVRTLVTLPEEGESTFVHVAVRPGSTLDDLTVVTTTTAEGFHDLRWTRLVDGEVVVAHTAFEGAYAPAAAASTTASLSVPVWAPDGSAVAWIDQVGGDATLRVVGWDDGPGTGDPATDNTAFTLELPAGVPLHLQEWVGSVSTVEGMTEIRAVRDDLTTGWYTIPLLRQADGAWSQPAGAPSVTAEPGPPVDGVTAALAGVTDDVVVRFMVRLTDVGAVLVTDPYGTAVSTALPDDLQPDARAAALWLAPAGDGVVVGGSEAGVAWAVAPDGTLTPLDVPIRWGSTLR